MSNRLPVGSLKDASDVIDGIVHGALRTAGDIHVEGAPNIMGPEGQEMFAERVLMQIPNLDALRGILGRVQTARLAD